MFKEILPAQEIRKLQYQIEKNNNIKWVPTKQNSFFKLKAKRIAENKESSLFIDPSPENEERYELQVYLRLTVLEESKKEQPKEIDSYFFENRNTSDKSQD